MRNICLPASTVQPSILINQPGHTLAVNGSTIPQVPLFLASLFALILEPAVPPPLPPENGNSSAPWSTTIRCLYSLKSGFSPSFLPRSRALQTKSPLVAPLHHLVFAGRHDRFCPWPHPSRHSYLLLPLSVKTCITYIYRAHLPLIRWPL